MTVIAWSNYNALHSKIRTFRYLFLSGNNHIDFDEFVKVMAKSSESDIEEHIRLAFKEFDKDDSGSISADELRQVSTNINDAAFHLY